MTEGRARNVHDVHEVQPNISRPASWGLRQQKSPARAAHTGECSLVGRPESGRVAGRRLHGTTHQQERGTQAAYLSRYADIRMSYPLTSWGRSIAATAKSGLSPSSSQAWSITTGRASMNG